MDKNDAKVPLELSTIPGWHALDKIEQKWLKEHTKKAVAYQQQSELKKLECIAEIYRVRKFLHGKQMDFIDWVKTNFQISERTVFRWLGSHQLLLASASNEDILYLAERVPGINNFGPREVANVLKRLPPPTAYENKEIWPVAVREALGQKKRAQIEGRMTLSADDGKKQFITTGIKVLRESKFETQLDELAWLRETVGMIMEGRALDGTLKVERLLIPEGFMPKRGRPRKK